MKNFGPTGYKPPIWARNKEESIPLFIFIVEKLGRGKIHISLKSKQVRAP